ncbi:element excision factor XisH family protein [Deltaproteobacteria bacterium TL4]
MPARDIYHDAVKKALIKENWHITHDPFKLKWGAKDLYVDLGAEKLLAAEKDSSKIAVEVKSFVGASDVKDLEEAVGQYVVYHAVLDQIEPDRKLYLAVREDVYHEVFEEPLGKLLQVCQHIQLLIFDEDQERIVTWIP